MNSQNIINSANVQQVVADYNYILENTNQLIRDVSPSEIIGLLDLAYSIGMIEGDVEDDKSNG